MIAVCGCFLIRHEGDAVLRIQVVLDVLVDASQALFLVGFEHASAGLGADTRQGFASVWPLLGFRHPWIAVAWISARIAAGITAWVASRVSSARIFVAIVWLPHREAAIRGLTLLVIDGV